MEDVALGLYIKIRRKFYGLVSEDAQIQAVFHRESEATLADVSLLSRKVGEYAVKSLSDYLTEDNLPGGMPYWNILQRTILPIMQEVHEVIFRMAASVQKKEDAKNRIGIKPIRPKFPKERITVVLNRLSAIFAEEDADE